MNHEIEETIREHFGTVKEIDKIGWQLTLLKRTRLKLVEQLQALIYADSDVESNCSEEMAYILGDHVAIVEFDEGEINEGGIKYYPIASQPNLKKDINFPEDIETALSSFDESDRDYYIKNVVRMQLVKDGRIEGIAYASSGGYFQLPNAGGGGHPDNPPCPPAIGIGGKVSPANSELLDFLRRLKQEELDRSVALSDLLELPENVRSILDKEIYSTFDYAREAVLSRLRGEGFLPKETKCGDREYDDPAILEKMAEEGGVFSKATKEEVYGGTDCDRPIAPANIRSMQKIYQDPVEGDPWQTPTENTPEYHDGIVWDKANGATSVKVSDAAVEQIKNAPRLRSQINVHCSN